MLPSITCDNIRVPEASAAKVIKSLLVINVTRPSPKKERRPHVFVAGASPQLGTHILIFRTAPAFGLQNRMRVQSRSTQTLAFSWTLNAVHFGLKDTPPHI